MKESLSTADQKVIIHFQQETLMANDPGCMLLYLAVIIFIWLDARLPYDVTITKENESFGFFLWFDENGHYIEDVTIGGAADVAGLKIGDRVIEVS